MPPTPTPETRNAFSVLMAHRVRSSSNASPPPPKRPHSFVVGRDGLGAYISNPSSHPPSIVISHSPTSVCIRDRYPKSLVHTLLLTRDIVRSLLSPLDAFDDPDFLSSVRHDAAILQKLVGGELRRRFGAQDGRDWVSEVRVGVHARPSMNHLHVHVMGPDRMGAYMKSRKHYLTFMEPFWIPLDQFPIPESEKKRRGKKREVEKGAYCWRCSMGFAGWNWPTIRKHLDKEFEAWCKEGGGGVKKGIEGKEKEAEVEAVGGGGGGGGVGEGKEAGAGAAEEYEAVYDVAEEEEENK